ncbi:MAG: UDP-N-acetylmuramate--L-alanine ligase [Thermoleophilia bacterium]|nr:UDP-N-acetylmuramate--L-alanine ligase [Thermoleophilia bacterium]
MIGVGGAGMSGLARLAVAAGYRVAGSDREPSPTLESLRRLGVDARAGHTAEHVAKDVDAVVVSTAIAETNPELAVARERDLPVLHRADLLAELMAACRGVAVAGAHGKSTTSGMLVAALDDPSACVGATIDGGGGTGARWGSGEWFVAEADESDRSLLKLAPEAAILLNVDHDHHSTYADIGAVEEVFRQFVAALPARGLLVTGPDERARRVAVAAPCEVRAVGPGPDSWAELVAVAPGRFVLRLASGEQQPFELSVPGMHNGHNAACALAMAEWCGVALSEAAERVRGFGGVGRRFELRGEARGIRVVDDYAHHPVEVAATLEAARETDAERLVVVFQPHLYSRTRELAAEFAEALASADLVVVTEVYAAREPHDPGVSGVQVADAIPQAIFVPLLRDVPRALCPQLRSGDLVLTMGAGDVTTLAGSLLSHIEQVWDERTRDL